MDRQRPTAHRARPSCGGLCDHAALLFLSPRLFFHLMHSFLRSLLARPELAPVPESCSAELALHAALLANPERPVAPAELQRLQDADVQSSYALFLRLQAGLLAAGSLQAYYVSLFPRQSPGAAVPAVAISIPPLFIDLLAEAILRELLAGDTSPYTLRAAEMLHRPQRISTEGGAVLSGDQSTLDILNETGGLGDFGRFLAEAKAPLRSIDMQVLNDDNAAAYAAAWQAETPERHRYLLDLTHEVRNDLSHGLVLTMTRARSGLTALAAVLERWVQALMGVTVTITALQNIDDAAWRWHIGLDAQATALLNDLYDQQEVTPERLSRLVSLFRLDFANPGDMRADVAGKPVYLGLMMAPGGVLRLKPQNLLVNLPLHAAQ